LLYSTFIGGNINDRGYGIIVDSEKNIYIIGTTLSSDFPTTSSGFDNSQGGYFDVFVLKLNLLTAHIDSISPIPSVEGKTITFEGSGTNGGDVVRYLWSSSLDGELYNGTDASFSLLNLSVGNHTISLRVQDNRSAWSEEVSTTLEIKKKEDEGAGFELTLMLLVLAGCVVVVGRKKNG